MTNIDSTRITDAEWKKWAEDADKAEGNDKKDGILLNSAFEKNYVNEQARKAGKTDNEISAFWSSVEAPAEASTATEIMGGEFSHSKKATNVIHNNILSHIYSKGTELQGSNIDWKQLSADVRQEILGNANQDPAKYANLMDEVDKMAGFMQEVKYNSKEDVRNLYKSLEDKVDSKDPNREFKLNVLKQFINVAEANQKQKERNQVNEKYAELAKTPNADREQIVKTLKENFKGSYFNDIVKEFEEDTIQKSATQEVWDLINAQKGSGITDGKKIESAVIEELKAKGHYDKYAKKALNGRKSMSFSEVMNFEQSNVKAKRKAVATDNRVAERTSEEYTEDDFLKRLKHDDALAGLIKSGLIVQNKDEQGRPIENSYDLTNLAERIREKVGADLKATKEKSDYYAYDEVENIVRNLTAETGVQLSRKDAKALIKMCGFPIEKKNWVKILYAGTVGSISDLASSAVSAVSVGSKAVAKNVRYNGNRGPFKVTMDPVTLTKDYHKTVPFTLNITDKNHLELLFEADGGAVVDIEKLLDSLAGSGLTSDNVQLEQLENGFKLIIDEKSKTVVNVFKDIDETISMTSGPLSKEVLPEELGIDFDDVSADAESKTKNVIPAMLKGLLVGMALNILSEALKEQGSKPIEVTQFNTNDIDIYKKEIDASKKLTPAQKEGFKALADVYIKLDEKGQPVRDKDGKLVWDSERFKLALNKMAGDGSTLIRQEFAVGVDNALRQYTEAMKTAAEKKPVEQVETQTVEKPVEPEKKPEVKIGVEEVKQADKQLEPNFYTGNKHTWKGIAALYGAKTPAEIKAVYTELKQINGISPKDTVIPKDLYLPDTLGEGKWQKAEFGDVKEREKFIYDNDKKNLQHGPVISSATNLEIVRQGSKYRGFKTVDGKIVGTTGLYDTQEEAEDAAKKLPDNPPEK